jgi:hypothetical protein
MKGRVVMNGWCGRGRGEVGAPMRYQVAIFSFGIAIRGLQPTQHLEGRMRLF